MAAKQGVLAAWRGAAEDGVTGYRAAWGRPTDVELSARNSVVATFVGTFGRVVPLNSVEVALPVLFRRLDLVVVDRVCRQRRRVAVGSARDRGTVERGCSRCLRWCRGRRSSRPPARGSSKSGSSAMSSTPWRLGPSGPMGPSRRHWTRRIDARTRGVRSRDFIVVRRTAAARGVAIRGGGDRRAPFNAVGLSPPVLVPR